ncbi:hypothetical protein ACS0TY_018581 [Phlomoides rotata]
MISNQIIRTPNFRSLLKLQSPSTRFKKSLIAFLISTNSSECWFRPSIIARHISAGFTKIPEEKIVKCREPLSFFFRRAVGAPKKIENTDFHAENAKVKEELIESKEQVTNLKEKLEEEIRSLNKKRPEKEHKLKLSSKKIDSNERKGKRSVLSLLANEKTKEVNAVKPSENPIVHKELSSDMLMFSQHLYVHGYFKNANFIPRKKFDVTCFEHSYAREFLKFAAESFGKDHQQIAKWLSAKDLKTVALFGCPSLGQKSIYAAKHMRRFFEVDEQKVCQRCVLKDSCENANKKCKKASTQLYMTDVNRVLIMYAMESVPQKLVLPQEIKDCVSRLLKEIVIGRQKALDWRLQLAIAKQKEKERLFTETMPRIAKLKPRLCFCQI